jgi:uncharacterized protein (DUF1786 family)
MEAGAKEAHSDDGSHGCYQNDSCQSGDPEEGREAPRSYHSHQGGDPGADQEVLRSCHSCQSGDLGVGREEELRSRPHHAMEGDR